MQIPNFNQLKLISLLAAVRNSVENDTTCVQL
jgi:hypothetical protein